MKRFAFVATFAMALCLLAQATSMAQPGGRGGAGGRGGVGGVGGVDDFCCGVAHV